jgi:RNA-directed DNA polymerase
LGNLSTPKTVQKLQKALHAKAKAEAGYRFYALYDKISRDDILAHAYAQCRSNKGAPGVDGQDFADIETYGVERWPGGGTLSIGWVCLADVGGLGRAVRGLERVGPRR